MKKEALETMDGVLTEHKYRRGPIDRSPYKELLTGKQQIFHVWYLSNVEMSAKKFGDIRYRNRYGRFILIGDFPINFSSKIYNSSL